MFKKGLNINRSKNVFPKIIHCGIPAVVAKRSKVQHNSSQLLWHSLSPRFESRSRPFHTLLTET